MRNEGDVTIKELEEDIRRCQKALEEHDNHNIWIEVKKILFSYEERTKEFTELAKDLRRSRDSMNTKIINTELKLVNARNELSILRKEIRNLKKGERK